MVFLNIVDMTVSLRSISARRGLKIGRASG